MFQKTAELARLGIVEEQRSELVAVLAEQLETDLRIAGIAFRAAGFEGLAIARGGRGIDRIEGDKLISEEGADERAFGSPRRPERDGVAAEAFPERLGPGGDGFGSLGQSGRCTLPAGAVVEAEGMGLIGPVQADEGRELGLS